MNMAGSDCVVEQTEKAREGGATILLGGFLVGAGAVLLIGGSGGLGSATEFKDGMLHTIVSLTGLLATKMGWEQVSNGMRLIDA